MLLLPAVAGAAAGATDGATAGAGRLVQIVEEIADVAGLRALGGHDCQRDSSESPKSGRSPRNGGRQREDACDDRRRQYPRGDLLRPQIEQELGLVSSCWHALFWPSLKIATNACEIHVYRYSGVCSALIFGFGWAIKGKDCVGSVPSKTFLPPGRQRLTNAPRTLTLLYFPYYVPWVFPSRCQGWRRWTVIVVRRGRRREGQA